MTKETAIKLFQDQRVRVLWSNEVEKQYFSIIDVIGVLTESERPRKYWSDLKTKLKAEGSEVSDKIGQLKMKSPDGKMRQTDVADTEQLLRLIQSIPSPKTEPFKVWLAKVGYERIEETEDPEKAWTGLTTREYKDFKDLKKENLRDNMTNLELVLNMLAEASTTEISKETDPNTFEENKQVAQKGGKVADAAKKQLESTTGKKVISPLNSKDLDKKISNED